MIQIRHAEQRGHANHGWLQSAHTFSFANYHDPAWMGWGALRVINEDRVAPGQGFGTHPHHNMEIISYVLEGALEHRDSMGHGAQLTPGEFQRISAGSGITHSEFNPSRNELVHFYQIWLEPDRRDTVPSYEQRRFAIQNQPNQLRLVASPGGEADSLVLQQDAKIYLAELENSQSLKIELGEQRLGWLQVLRGDLQVNETRISAGDGVGVRSEPGIQLTAFAASELMWFDLPGPG